MSQGLVDVLTATDFEKPPEGFDPHTDSGVVLDDGDTYSGIEGARVWLDGKGYLITELLDFYLASVAVEAADPEDGDGEQYFEDPCPCGSHYHQPHDCPIDEWQ